VDLSDDEEKTLNITLNKVRGDWDNSKLAELLEELEQLDIDLLLTGFDQNELDKILDNVNFDMGSLDDQGDLSKLEPKSVKSITCPHCLEEFEV
jgi:deoxyribodipyrimidine photolyase